MPVFISYSHEDKDFVDKLAGQLVVRNVNIWLDRWELNLGDSLIDKVQEAVDGASALLVILSKASTKSEWCKKELSSGLLRELEEKRVVVMPVMLEDCDVPIFARGKMYADFRTNFDDGLQTVVEGIAKVTNPYLARIKEPEYHIDWSIDWGDIDGNFALILNYVEQAQNQPYSILTNIEVLCSPVVTEKYHLESREKSEHIARKNIMGAISKNIEKMPEIKPLLVNEKANVETVLIEGDNTGELYRLRISTRRLGEDTGRDILINTSTLITGTYRHMEDVIGEPSEKKA